MIEPTMRRATILLIVLALALSGGAFWVQEWSLDRYGLALPIPEWLWVNLAVGWAFMLAGLTARRLRPDSGIGTLMVWLGLVWIGRLVLTAPLVQWEAIGWGVAFYGILFLILYSFPSGRFAGAERIGAGVWIGLTLAIGVAILAFADPYGEFDDSVCCPEHLLLIRNDPRVNETILTWAGVAGAVALAAIVIAQLIRWRRASTVGRRSISGVGVILVPLILILVLIPAINAITTGVSSFTPEAELLGRGRLYVQNGALLVLPVVILAQLLATRLSRGRVADLVGSLDPNLSPADLQGTIRRTLADPAATIAFSREGGEEPVGIDGTALATDGGRVLTTIDEGVGILHDPGLDEELVRAVGSAARLALDNVRLQAELRAQLIEVQDSRRRIVTAADDARRRIERDLHDGAQQRLVALSAALRAARSRPDSDELKQLLDAAAREAEGAIDELRDLAHGLHPAILSQAGLHEAVASLADRSPVPVVTAVERRRYAPDAEATAYFVIAEGLANATKHAAATEIAVTAEVEGDVLVVGVTDDGRGGADPAGAGIRGLVDRVQAAAGRLVIESAPGGGTRLQATIPIDPEEGV